MENTCVQWSDRIWWTIQGIVWCVGLTLLVVLALAPSLGLTLFWDGLIPVAPALVAIAPGIWRNVCPLGTTSQLARHLGLSRRVRLGRVWQGRLALIGVSLLFAIVPLRHVMLNTSGLATLAVLVFLGIIAIFMGFTFEGKSGWCSGMCPVHPVEKLYGQRPALTVPNAHCSECTRCAPVCPDSTGGMGPSAGVQGPSHRLAATLMIGAFPGFVWGWFHVPDYLQGGWSHLAQAYGVPFGAAGVTLVMYLAILRATDQAGHRVIGRAFAALAIATYYWYRLPALLGFGLYPGQGMLIDLSQFTSPWTIMALQIASSVFWVVWLVGRLDRGRSWCTRPVFATETSVPQA